jgi:dihydroneopterin aldolase
MSDIIRVIDLEVFARIGVPEEERREAQRLLLSLEISIDSISPAAATDDLEKTVNYYDVAQRVKAFAIERPRKLIETLAEEMAHDLLKKFPIETIALEIKKFILPDARYVSVKIERSRHRLSA